MNDNYQHTSVLLHESIEGLNIKPDGVYVDCTFGGGGHSRAILAQLGPKGKLFAFDHDKDAWQNEINDKRFTLIRENFEYIDRFLRLYGVPKVDGILADLGVSSFHFDTAERGFSIRFDAPLDMRMDARLEKTAADILAQYSEERLHKLFEEYGEVRNARTLAKTIVAKRKTHAIKTIEGFKNAISECNKGNPNRYLAQVFQALRIEVNNELGVLAQFLERSAQCLKPGGRLAIITFHSLEDRMVKVMMREGTLKENATDEFGRKLIVSPFKVLKDVLPSEEELKQNNRSRSARLRVAEYKERNDG